MYLDPGFGSMIIQFLIALIAGGGAYLLLIRKKIVIFFQKRKERKNAPAEIKEEGFKNDDERV